MAQDTLDPTSTANVKSVQTDGPATGDKPTVLNFSDRSAKDLPPRKQPRSAKRATAGTSSRTASSSTSNSAPQPMSRQAIIEGVAGLYGLGGTLVAPVAPILGTSLVQNAETIGTAWAEAAAQSETMRRVVENMLTGNVMTQLLFAHVPIGMAAFAELQSRREAKAAARAKVREASASPTVPGMNHKVPA